LIELTADRLIASRNSASLNIAFTRSWQSSNVPSTATACAFGCVDRGHLPTLHLARAAERVEDDDVDVLASGDTVDRRRTGVAARGADDRDPLATLAEHVVEHPADELQRDVLERQRRAVEQLLDPLAMSSCTSGTTAGGGRSRTPRCTAG
jgi:hypothetical protein